MLRAAFKPTSTIGKEQRTVTRSGQSVVSNGALNTLVHQRFLFRLSSDLFAGDEAVVLGKGRHDPCVLPRAVPVVEAMVALVLVDALMQHTAQCRLLDGTRESDLAVSQINALGKQL